MKAQATMNEEEVVKKTLGQHIGRGATKATMGTAFGIGRFAFNASKNFIAGAAEAGRESKAGYDEAKEDAIDEADAEANAKALAKAAKK